MLVFVWLLCAAFAKLPDCKCEKSSLESTSSCTLDLTQHLRKRRFFRIYKVALHNECTYWKEGFKCNKETCNVKECCNADIPSKFKEEDELDRRLPPNSPTWQEDESIMWVTPNEPDYTYVDLERNQEGFTGYVGKSPRRIWSEIYKQNCFEDYFEGKEQCLESRVFYRIISGFHAEVSTHIASRYIYGSGKKKVIMENKAIFDYKLGNYPERIDNLYFTYVVLLRAINRASPILKNYNYETGDEEDDRETKRLMNELLNTDLIASCTKDKSFDEEELFRGKQVKKIKQFRQSFFNISRIIDCTGCTKCRLHGKMQLIGLGTALRILFSDISSLQLTRNEIISLIVTAAKFGSSVEIIRKFRQADTNDNTVLMATIGFGLLAFLSCPFFFRGCLDCCAERDKED